MTSAARIPELELTILMPCLNEAETIARCIEKAHDFLRRARVEGEVLIADNGSSDGSPAIAERLGARVVRVPARGYGSALRAGIAAAHGRYVVMGDADDSYDFSRLELFLEHLRAGDELVMGNRFAGGIRPGAMPPLHRYLGNPVLSFIGRLFFRSPVRDFHCGLRGFSRQALAALDLQASGMEFASEMVVKATLARLRISEVPTVLWPDGRSRPPHLRSWRDGWRHLRFLLLMSPNWLFFYPGLAFLALGTLLSGMIAAGPVRVGGLGLDIHTMLYAATGGVIGLQLLIFALLTKAVGSARRLLPPSPRFQRFLRFFTLERGLLLGAALLLAGLGFALYSVHLWVAASLSALSPQAMMRFAIPSVALIIAGTELMSASFVLSFIHGVGDHKAQADAIGS